MSTAAPTLLCWENADSGGSTTTSLTVNKPTSSSTNGDRPRNAKKGDLLIILAGSDTSSDTLQWDGTTYFPTGFTFLYCWNNSTIQAGVTAFARVVDGTEGSSFDVPAMDANEMWASCLLIRGWTGSIGDLVVGTRNGDGTPVPLSIPSINTTANNSLCIALASFDGADSGGFTWTSPYTKRAEVYSGSSGNDASGTWATYVKPTTGATGVADVTYVSTGDGMIGFQLAIPPEVQLHVDANLTALTASAEVTVTGGGAELDAAVDAELPIITSTAAATRQQHLTADVDANLNAITASAEATSIGHIDVAVDANISPITSSVAVTSTGNIDTSVDANLSPLTSSAAATRQQHLTVSVDAALTNITANATITAGKVANVDATLPVVEASIAATLNRNVSVAATLPVIEASAAVTSTGNTSTNTDAFLPDITASAAVNRKQK